MKADSCGTYTEQLRYKMAWITPRQVRDSGNPDIVTCFRCKHSAFKSMSSRSCLHLDGGFATVAGASCESGEVSILG